MTAFLNEHPNGAGRTFTDQKQYKPHGCLTVIVAIAITVILLYLNCA
jgi:hypothetical protein